MSDQLLDGLQVLGVVAPQTLRESSKVCSMEMFNTFKGRLFYDTAFTPQPRDFRTLFGSFRGTGARNLHCQRSLTSGAGRRRLSGSCGTSRGLPGDVSGEAADPRSRCQGRKTKKKVDKH